MFTMLFKKLLIIEDDLLCLNKGCLVRLLTLSELQCLPCYLKKLLKIEDDLLCLNQGCLVRLLILSELQCTENVVS